MKKGVKKIIFGLLSIILCIFIYMIIPYSPIKKEYLNNVKNFKQSYQMPKYKITENDLKVLPEALQKYFVKNGYLGIESANAVKFDFKDADFLISRSKPKIKIDYVVYDFIKEPIRIALIDSKMYGIPFQGIDLCKDGGCSMKGVIAKHIPLFNESYDFIDATYLSECLMHPSLALQKNITYRQLDDYSVEATIRKNDKETTGVFYFNKSDEMTSFVAKKRFCSDTNTYEKWSAIVDDYKIINGINIPTKFQAVWNFESDNLIYFDSNGMEISYT
ncbi:DUF6544 family protein [Clostridium sp. BJN0001]|uniref:DUF6544 family protein n=1 Tax=Clostridium sp. BJN0001 TaxID=2930219 RepID=UPI001FD2DCD6|nr:DUF6544 family protein [Clostridium sp. BJN0001]